MNKLLIVSALRSGTSYTTKILNTIGIATTHDYWRAHTISMIRPPKQVEITGWSRALLDNPVLQANVRTAAQFRNPLYVVKSTLWSWQNPTYGLHPFPSRAQKLRQSYLENYQLITGTPMPEGISQAEKVCRYIYESYKRSRDTAEFSYRVEDMHNALPILLNMIDASIDDDMVAFALSEIPTNFNTRTRDKDPAVWHQQLTWADMIPELVDLSESLGYDTKGI